MRKRPARQLSLPFDDRDDRERADTDRASRDRVTVVSQLGAAVRGPDPNPDDLNGGCACGVRATRLIEAGALEHAACMLPRDAELTRVTAVDIDTLSARYQRL